MQALIFESLEYFWDLELFMLLFLKVCTILETWNCSCCHFWKQGQLKNLKLPKIPFLKAWRTLDTHTKKFVPKQPKLFLQTITHSHPNNPNNTNYFLQNASTNHPNHFLQTASTNPPNNPNHFYKPPQQSQICFPKAPQLLKLFKG